MRADLYICDETFSYNGKDSPRKVKYKLLLFHDLIEKIREHREENKLYLVKENFLKTPLCKNGVTVEDVLFSYEESKKKYGREIVILFQSLFDHCDFSHATTSDMKEYLNLDSHEECNGILVLNELPGYEKNVQVLATINGWLCFRRHYLEKYPPENRTVFLEELKKYCPSIKIHTSVDNCIKEVFPSHSKRIVKYLGIMDEFFLPEFKKYRGSNIEFIGFFAKSHGMDDASYEGNKDKDRFEVEFEDGFKAYCETHLKMYKDDSGNEGQHCRIYFKPPEEGDTFVYIGFICRHL